MASLKAYTPKLAQLLGMTSAALYERQRALVRARLLQQGEARGPGSGVRADASSVAWLLIAVMAAGGLSEASERAAEIAAIRPKGGCCPETRTRSFHGSLAAILASRGLAERVLRIRVSQSSPSASIIYRLSKAARIMRTVTVTFSREPRPVSVLRAFMELEGSALPEIAKDIEIMADQSGEQPLSRSHTSGGS